MIGLILAFAIAMVLSISLTPLLIRFLITHQYGQFIRQDGPTQHLTKRGTPTMGGLVMIFATVVAWLIGSSISGAGPSWSGVCLLILFVGLGIIGLLDDGIKIMRQRSLGLHPGGKIFGQVAVASLFAWASLSVPNRRGVTPGSLAISFTRPSALTFAVAGAVIGVILYLIWTNFIVAAWSNAVNLTDGLDGLAAGCSIFVFGSYTFISYFQVVQSCSHVADNVGACYQTRDPLDLAVFCAALVGSLAGFLWWNASPAQIFMGDTGALALGGAVAGLSILTHTEFLAIIIGGLFVIITLSDVIQIGVFKATGKRVFRMAPLHHHFELKGWKEITIVIRFWLVAALLAITGAGVFYAEWVSYL
ncbi:phospho-N-acetylmuramoyl-pentapeptide-transferase [Schaalia sp. ZJ405]|uniref:phospho-N-acetylmuramoyl-pentapeptide- transferase n=1 Tax=unclassified Schaalia TaxID=2691889 RepID=UPI0013EA6641|nr:MULTISPECIES: phospho-N-acetylmuramoyl-pentapeptide-transferase [unclassified Schaalia]QPK81866.1 phospho-N-acetylmuramoyl-pentapeptide-transferase [Schaalia sp. ZJ405]